MISQDFLPRIYLLLSLVLVASLIGACHKPAPPTVDPIVVKPGTTLLVGETATMTIRVSDIAPQFEWKAERGKLSDPSKSSVLYTAPDSPGPDTVTVTVVDEGGSNVKSVSLTIVAPTATPTPTPEPTPTATPTPAPSPTLTATSMAPSTQGAVDSDVMAVEWVETIPWYYISLDYNIMLLHPSELEIIKHLYNIEEMHDQMLVFHRSDIVQPDEYIKELIGPFVVRNERSGQEVIAWVTSTTPDFALDIRDNTVSMPHRLRGELGVEVGTASVRFAPAEKQLYSMQLAVRRGINPSWYRPGRGDEEEEEENEGVGAVILNNPLPSGMASTVLTEQSAIDLTLVRKISAHEHYWSGGDIELFIQAMDATGIEKAVFLPTGVGPDNRGYQQNMKELLEIRRRDYPDRIIVFATVDEADPNAPQVLEQAVEDGAQGLKLIGGHPNYYDEPLNSENMHRIIQKCDDLSLPVLIHVSMLEHPDMAAEFEDLLTSFPTVTFIAAHYGKFAPELHRMADMLDKYPNLYTDLSMGGGLCTYLAQIHNEPDKFREFIIHYQDRILWGTDIVLSKEDTLEFLRTRIESDMYLLSREVHVSPFFSSVIPLNGLNLPDSVLNKILWENPQRVLDITIEP